jgi:hypothetical protein
MDREQGADPGYDKQQGLGAEMDARDEGDTKDLQRIGPGHDCGHHMGEENQRRLS